MQSTLDLEIRDELARYLAGQLSLRRFKKWFVSHTWDIHLSGNPEAADLAHEIGLYLAEFSNRDWSEDELKGQLRHLVETHTGVLDDPGPVRSDLLR